MKNTLHRLLFIALLLIFAGCEREDVRIVGVWERVFIDGIERDYIREWHFFENNDLVIRDIYNNGNEIEYNGIYRVKPVFKRTYLGIDDLPFVQDFTAYNTDWRVHRLDSEVLVIFHTDDGGVLKREFVRKD